MIYEQLKCYFGKDPIMNQEAENFQGACFCRTHGVYINPYGVTCELCKVKQWPADVALDTQIREIMKREDATLEEIELFEHNIVEHTKMGRYSPAAVVNVLRRTQWDVFVRGFLKNKEKEKNDSGDVN